MHKNLLTYPLQQWGNILDLLNSCIDSDIRLNLTPGGISTKMVDSANVFLTCMTIPRKSFLEYNVRKETTVGFPVKAVLDKLKNAYYNDIDLGDTFSISGIYTRNQGDRERTLIYCKAGNFSFSVQASDPSDIREPRYPKIDLPFQYRVSTEELYNATRLMDEGAGSVWFANTQLFQAKNHTAYSTTNRYILKTAEILRKDGKAKSLFSLEQLLDPLKALRDVCKTATVTLGVDWPIIITARGPRGESFDLLQAPRIEC